jgi:hypothetical protein
MEVDASGKIEDSFRRGCDKGRKVNGWHFGWVLDIDVHFQEKIIPKPSEWPHRQGDLQKPAAIRRGREPAGAS